MTLPDSPLPPAENHPTTDEASMPLVEHLIELRKRLLLCLSVVMVIFFSLLTFSNTLYAFVAKPIRDQLPPGTTMIATDITSTFLAPFKLTFVLAIFLAIPVILHQLWKFIAPGLYAKERRLVLPLLISSVILFYMGVAFAYFITFPLIMTFFATTTPIGVQLTPDIQKYLDIALKLFFAFGAAFEIPVATVLCVWSGLTTVAALKEKRPYMIVGFFIIGMLLTPPDALSQILLSVPMCLLFEAGILFSQWFISRSKKIP